MDKALLLLEFKILGECFTSYEINNSDYRDLFKTLPYLYVVVIVERDEYNITPLGGILVKSDIPKTHPNLLSTMRRAIEFSKNVSPVLRSDKGLQIIPTKYHSNDIPTLKMCEEIVGGAIIRYSWGTNC